MLNVNLLPKKNQTNIQTFNYILKPRPVKKSKLNLLNTRNITTNDVNRDTHHNTREVKM